MLGSKAPGNDALERHARASLGLLVGSAAKSKSASWKTNSTRWSTDEIEPWPSLRVLSLPWSDVLVRRTTTGGSATAKPLPAAASWVKASSMWGRKWSSPLSSETSELSVAARISVANDPCWSHSARIGLKSVHPCVTAAARNAALSPPALVPVSTSAFGATSSSAQMAAHGLASSVFPSAASRPPWIARSTSSATPPIQMARLTPPLSANASRISVATGSPHCRARVVLSW